MIYEYFVFTQNLKSADFKALPRPEAACPNINLYIDSPIHSKGSNVYVGGGPKK